MISVFLVYNVFGKFDTSKLQAETVGVATLPWEDRFWPALKD